MTRWRMRDDDGISLLESLVAVAIVGIVMTAVTSFFIRSVSATGQQRGKQIATHLADSGMERVRALKGSAVADGRVAGGIALPDGDPLKDAAVKLLASSRQLNAASIVSAPVLPVSPETVTVAGTDYLRYWYVGECALPETGTGASDADTCVTPEADGRVTLFRVVVAVTWTDRNCPANRCLYVTSSLVSSEPDEPVFNENEAAAPPVIENPGPLRGNITTPETRTADGLTVVSAFTFSGDAKPLTVSGDNIPPGVTVNSNGQITGTPTKTGTYTVTIRVTDIRGLVGTETFVWTIYTAPKLNPIPNQTTVSGAPVNLQPVNAGAGEGALTWSVSGAVPAGITFDPATGQFTGSPSSGSLTTPAPQSVATLAVRLTDSIGQFSEVAFTWTVNDWRLPTTGTRTTKANVAVDTPATATGGMAPLTWSAVNLPPNLTIAPSTGRITGTPTTKGTYDVIVTARDARGETRSATFKWNIT